MFSVLTSLHSVQNVTLSAQNVTLSAQNVTLSAQNVTLSAQNVILLIIGRYYKTLSTILRMFWVWSGFVNRYQSLRDDPRFICYDGICFNLAMLPLLNYQSYKITFTIMISLLSIPFPEWFFCSNSKIRNKKNRKKTTKFSKKIYVLIRYPVRSGPVNRIGSPDPVRSGPVSKIPIRSAPILDPYTLYYRVQLMVQSPNS